MVVTVAADGAVLAAVYPDRDVAEVTVQPFGSGGYDVGFLTTIEASPVRSVMAVTADGGDAVATDLYCNYATSRDYSYQVTVRVQTVRGDGEPADCAFRLDLRLAW